MWLTCQECGSQFEGKKRTKYCKKCRPKVRRRRSKEYRATHKSPAKPNYCYECGKLVPKYKKFCDDCLYNKYICIFCGEQFEIRRSVTRPFFCSLICSHQFYSRRNVMGMRERLNKLRERYRYIEQILKAERQLGDELREKNKELKQQIKQIEYLEDRERRNRQGG